VERALELTQRHRVALEHFLAQVHRNLDGIVPGEARITEAGADGIGRLLQTVEAQVLEAVRADVLLDLLSLHLRGDQLALVTGVDAVEARPLDRR